MLLLDTCALIWSVNGDRLAPYATHEIEKALRGKCVLVPGVCMGNRVAGEPEKNNAGRAGGGIGEAVFARPGIRIAALTPDIAVRASFLPGVLHPDPADRLLVSTALAMGLRLVTRDQRLIEYGAQGYAAVLEC